MGQWDCRQTQAKASGRNLRSLVGQKCFGRGAATAAIAAIRSRTIVSRRRKSCIPACGQAELELGCGVSPVHPKYESGMQGTGSTSRACDVVLFCGHRGCQLDSSLATECEPHNLQSGGCCSGEQSQRARRGEPKGAENSAAQCRAERSSLNAGAHTCMHGPESRNRS